MCELLNIQVPFFFKNIIDQLNVDFSAVSASGVQATVLTVAGTAIIGCTRPPTVSELIVDGLARIGSAVFQELRNAIFANVAQKAIRQVACNTFSHLLSMDLAFHLSRQTGGLSRAIDRGTKGISSMLTWIVFHIAPTLLEIVLVSGILGYKFGWEYAGVAIGTMGLYILFTVKTTAWRCRGRREMALTIEQSSGNRLMLRIIKQQQSSSIP
jgi:ATP-binding cassette, subfamily B (MDR/TAP), member 7